MLAYAGKSPQVQTSVNLWLLVDEVVKMLQAAFKKNVVIELDLKRVVPDIIGDSSQIQQIVMNLIINAAEAIGEVSGTIRVALTRVLITDNHTETDTFGAVIKAGGYICLEVTDSGSGMDKETQKRIFEPFFTTKFTGRGLGMSAIHGIVTAHGALLHMTSRPNVGTTFKVFFPMPTAPDQTASTSPSADPSEKAEGTVLLVDDERVLRDMGTALLEAMGFTAVTAENGNRAIEIYRARGGEIDVILLDLTMPELDGIETYHQLRTINPTLPVIICSGYSVESVEDVITHDPHACFVQKPYNPAELRSALMGMLG
jgi:CheY-like chemotaxis protein